MLKEGLPEKMTPYCFAVKNSTLYAGCYEGLYFSTTNGTSWQYKKIENQAANPSFHNICIEDGFMIVTGKGAFISRDGGALWSNFNYKKDVYSVDNIIIKGEDIYIEDIDGLFLCNAKCDRLKYMTGPIKNETYFDEDGETKT